MKKISILYSLLIISLLMAMSACTSTRKTTSVVTPEIKYKKWALTSVNGVWVDSVTAKKAYVIFSADGTMGGNTGCNNFGGNYLIAQNNITLSGIKVTEMACPKNVFERPLLDAINKVNKYTVENSQLVLWNNEEKLIIFSPPAQ